MEPWGIDVGNMMFNYFGNNSWLMDNPEINTAVIKKGLEELNMFYMSHFLHNSSVLTLSSTEVVDEVAIDGALGKADLGKMVLPNTGHSGLLIVVLDPEMKIPDNNRTDNVFVEFVTVNSTAEPKTYCSVSPMSMGK